MRITDVELVDQKLDTIATCVGQLRSLARLDNLTCDVKEERFVLRTVQMAIQAAINAAGHIVSDELLGEPESSEDLFVRLQQRVALSDSLVLDLRRLVRFRDILVYEYDSVDLAVVRDIVEHKLGDLLEFARLVRAYLRKTS